MNEQRLTVGAMVRLRGGWLTIRRLIYAGMPSPGVISLVVMNERGYRGMGYNLFLPAGRRELELEGHRITIHEVDEESLRLRIERV